LFKVKCDDALSFWISIDGGKNDRKLTSNPTVTPENSIPYKIFSDEAKLTEYPIGTKIKFDTIPQQDKLVNLYGLIDVDGKTRIKGEYTDTLTVTLTF